MSSQPSSYIFQDCTFFTFPNVYDEAHMNPFFSCIMLCTLEYLKWLLTFVLRTLTAFLLIWIWKIFYFSSVRLIFFTHSQLLLIFWAALETAMPCILISWFYNFRLVPPSLSLAFYINQIFGWWPSFDLFKHTNIEQKKTQQRRRFTNPLPLFTFSFCLLINRRNIDNNIEKRCSHFLPSFTLFLC